MTPGMSIPRAVTSLEKRTPVGEARKASVAFMRLGWDMREWISQTGKETPRAVNSSNMRPAARAVGKKHMTSRDVSFALDRRAGRRTFETAVLCLAGLLLFDQLECSGVDVGWRDDDGELLDVLVRVVVGFCKSGDELVRGEKGERCDLRLSLWCAIQAAAYIPCGPPSGSWRRRAVSGAGFGSYPAEPA